MKGLHPRAGHLFAAAAVLALIAPSFAVAQAPAGATAVCGDGTYSSAPTKRGACSGHKGIKTWLADQKAAPKPAKAAPAKAAPATAPTPATAKPAGATGVCNDGSYTSAKSARGACAGHGGVKQWLNAPAAAPMAPKGPPPKAMPPKSLGAGAPANATGLCNDGSFTTAKGKRGACSAHGGLKNWIGEEEGAPPPKPTATPVPPKATPNVAPSPMAAPQANKPRPNAPVDAANATALCNDGTYSASQHRGGTCSRHGGVKQWLKQVPD